MQLDQPDVVDDGARVGGVDAFRDQLRVALVRQLADLNGIEKSVGQSERRKIGVGKVSVVVGFFFAAHRYRAFFVTVPQPRFLYDTPAALDDFDLAIDFEVDCFLNEAE